MTGNEGRIEELDTVGRPVVAPAAGRGPRLRARGLSLPAAVVGALIVGTLAFGAGGFRPAADTAPDAARPVAAEAPGADAAAGEDAGLLANGGGEDGRGGVPGGEGSDPGETAGPTAKPEPTGSPEPDVVEVDLAAVERDGRVRLEWGACDAAGIAAWKVVRSADEGVRWPLGEADDLVAVLDPASGAFTDAEPPEGRKSWYRVFAVADTDDGLVVRCASDTARVLVPGPEPTEKPEPTDKPEPTEKPEPTDTPEPADLELAVKVKEGFPYLDWSACKADGFHAYKVVASKDETVRWPMGENDMLRAAIGERDVTGFWDTDVPTGKTLWYRVFCVEAVDGGYEVLAASPARKVTTPDTDPGPKPDPVELGIEAGVDGGTVWLDWETCESDGFVYYKVVRAQHDDPSYLPWTDGTELVAVIEQPGASAWEDHDVRSGETWFYRIQSIGRWNGEKVLLGETRVVRVEIP